MSWSTLIDDLNTHDKLKHFSQQQVEATVALIAVVMHADDRVGFLEQQEFEALVEELPFFADKGSSTQQVESAISRAKAAGNEADYKAIIDTVAVHIDNSADREEVFRLAATMAYADHQMNAAESAVISWLAAAFTLDNPEKILDAVRGR